MELKEILEKIIILKGQNLHWDSYKQGVYLMYNSLFSHWMFVHTFVSLKFELFHYFSYTQNFLEE
jgi:hypothetical protein